MSELTKYNKVIGIMEQCQVGDYLWVKAEEAEQQIAYWKRCVETSKAVHQIDNETIRKQLDSISKLQGENGDLKVGIDDRDKQIEYWRGAYSKLFDRWDVTDGQASDWKYAGIGCFLIGLAEAIFIGVKLL